MAPRLTLNVTSCAAPAAKPSLRPPSAPETAIRAASQDGLCLCRTAETARRGGVDIAHGAGAVFRTRLPGLTLGWLRRGHAARLARHSSSFSIGFLNGFMIACGPLQAMYAMAAGTGGSLEGAKRLFAFGLGTLPLLVGSGYYAASLKARALVMLKPAVQNIEDSALEAGYQVIRMDVTKEGYQPDTFVLRKGVSLCWVIDTKGLTECNKGIVVPQLKLEISLMPGVQVVEFTPREAGGSLGAAGWG